MTSTPENENKENCPSCPFDQNLELLRNLRVFSSLPLESLRAYTFLCERIKYQQGDKLFTQNDTDNKAYLVIQGKLELCRMDDENGQEQIYSTFAEGEFLGGLALLCDVRRIFSLRAAEPSTCLILPRKKLLTELVANPEIGGIFINAIADRLIQWEERTLAHACKEGCSLPDVGISLI